MQRVFVQVHLRSIKWRRENFVTGELQNPAWFGYTIMEFPTRLALPVPRPIVSALKQVNCSDKFIVKDGMSVSLR